MWHTTSTRTACLMCAVAACLCIPSAQAPELPKEAPAIKAPELPTIKVGADGYCAWVLALF